MYEYKATVTKIVDGDTLNCDVDAGFSIVLRSQVIRLARINAPELSTEEGKLAKQFLTSYLLGKTILLRTIKGRKEKYGRYLGEIYLDSTNINDLLVAEKFAVLAV